MPATPWGRALRQCREVGLRVTEEDGVPVFRPTIADMRAPFEAYIEKAEPLLAQAGIGKLVPPRQWVPRKSGYDDLPDVTIEKAIKQHATGAKGLYRTLLVTQKPMSLRAQFAPMACSPSHRCKDESREDIERRFWKNLTFSPPIYGADIAGSLMDEECEEWNIRRLDTLLTRALAAKGVSIPGVISPYLYFGMWRSFFAWHTEDMDLYSMNYLHFGAPKTWYCVPPAHRRRFETVAQGLAPDLFRSCKEFLRHKELMISPTLLKQHNIPLLTMEQQPREWVINYPGAYHAGFNQGYNCAESTNFATKEWIAIGAQARPCPCSKDSVRINMSIFTGESSSEEDSRSSESEEESEEDSEEEEEAPAPARQRKPAKRARTAKPKRVAKVAKVPRPRKYVPLLNARGTLMRNVRSIYARGH